MNRSAIRAAIILAMVGGATWGYAIATIALALLEPLHLSHIAQVAITTPVVIAGVAGLGWRFWERIARWAIRMTSEERSSRDRDR